MPAKKFEKSMLTQGELMKRLTYNPGNGHFTRRRTASSDAKEKMKVGTVRNGYLTINIGEYKFQAGRLAWLYVYGVIPDGYIDHIDGNRLNNAISNLRVVDALMNSWNSKPPVTNKSGYRGVSWHKKGQKWQAQITYRGVHNHLGYYDSIESAAAAYEEAALRFRGEHHRHQKIRYHPGKPTTPKGTKNVGKRKPLEGYATTHEYKYALAKAVADGL